MVSNQFNASIPKLRVWLPPLVVLAHCAGTCGMGEAHFWNTSVCDFFVIFFSRGITKVATPCFFLISGYLFYLGFEGRWRWEIYCQKLRRRVFTLLIPYIAWNLIRASLLFIGSKMNLITQPELLQKLNPYDIFISSIDGSLWFLRDLIVVIVLSPLLFVFIKKSKLLGMLLLCFLHVSRLWPLQNIPGFSSVAICLFAIGGYFAICPKTDIALFCRNWRYVNYSLTITLLGFIVFCWNKYPIYPYLLSAFRIFGSFTLIDVACNCTSMKRLYTKLEPAAFFVFAAHEGLLILSFFSFMLSLSQLPDVINYFLCFILTYSLSLSLYFIVKVIFPPRISLIITAK